MKSLDNISLSLHSNNQRRLLIVFLSLVMVVKFFECKNQNSHKIIFHEYSRTDTLFQKDVLRVGFGSITSPQHTIRYYKELLNYISKEVNMRVVILQRKTYLEMNELLRDGGADLGFICTGAYVKAHEDYNAEILAVPVINGKPYYNSYIIVHKNSSIERFQDLRGKTFAFSDPLSLSGYLFPVYLLIQKGYHPAEYFSKVIFTYSHDNSILAVSRRFVDGAAVDGLVWDYLSNTEPELTNNTKVIMKSPDFGMPPIIVSPRVSSELKQKLKNIFLNIHNDPEAKEILKKLNIDKFVAGDNLSYDNARLIMRAIKKGK